MDNLKNLVRGEKKMIKKTTDLEGMILGKHADMLIIDDVNNNYIDFSTLEKYLDENHLIKNPMTSAIKQTPPILMYEDLMNVRRSFIEELVKSLL